MGSLWLSIRPMSATIGSHSLAMDIYMGWRQRRTQLNISIKGKKRSRSVFFVGFYRVVSRRCRGLGILGELLSMSQQIFLQLKSPAPVNTALLLKTRDKCCCIMNSSRYRDLQLMFSVASERCHRIKGGEPPAILTHMGWGSCSFFIAFRRSNPPLLCSSLVESWLGRLTCPALFLTTWQQQGWFNHKCALGPQLFTSQYSCSWNLKYYSIFWRNAMWLRQWMGVKFSSLDIFVRASDCLPHAPLTSLNFPLAETMW